MMAELDNYVRLVANGAAAEIVLTAAGAGAAVEETAFTLQAPTNSKYCILLEISSSAINEVDIEIQPGAYWRKDLGPLTVLEGDDTTPANTMLYALGPFESSRFKDEDGNITITITADGEDTINEAHYKAGVLVLP